VSSFSLNYSCYHVLIFAFFITITETQKVENKLVLITIINSLNTRNMFET